MPQDFDECVKKGGRVRTKELKGNRFIKICYDKEGKPHSGDVMKRKVKPKVDKEQKTKVLTESLLKLREHYNKHYHSN